MSSEMALADFATECGNRMAALETAMRARGLASLVVLGRGMITQYGHLQYLANYCPMIRVGALVVRLGVAPVLALPTAADIALAAPLTPIRDMRVATIGDDGTGSSSLARLIRELVSPGAADGATRIGVVGLDDILVAAEFARWQKTMPGVEFTSESALLARIKMRKSAFELREIDAAARIADDGFAALVAALRDGSSFRDASGAAERALRAQGAGEILVYITRGPHYRHRPPPGHPAQGELLTVFVELSSETGYWGEFARLIAVGALDPERQRLAAHCIGSMARTERLLRPGVTGASVYAAIAEDAKAAGYGFDASFGHGFGMDHDLPSISPGGSTVLEADMAISMHPQFLTADGALGASYGDAFVIGPASARRLSRVPPDLVVL